ncbi:MAG: hypothetical protein A3G52_04715 [Candidatus Taylorbacteria bacterium RIFCSPLOWO2_12_FULL_43_20]|uniref:Uncharacterized protein n=1 Tax=Candidatus Taylorbacteria bacterium RIFCSPLOWO2_12_FULL_43_20 TaxID=1802332 RepID=A0A1G2P4I6_9BACT|nr:MAG: hypothetical protein A2825_02705 [Candidatus Taylorbacteria bacterium RIFCSPHIGHO2_01_FULL_43_120]OHA23458.1 MAG: hypothetical protein A3B98_01260 [Candidatus Taylorbacteria bacterium RIFCSPHIGHO2_02_FULL_43_55]OHA29663.1 MAG: hypothetical protein A3E92_03565 [Candidatus Taylorbacteria bacterium RIFCSPHIGHO2_12_FULL_42_34]OHA31591.1 MAG: hypothetical protein A3B09_02660 [Candidatus Taylorbacteria bacterium RIFCSPLOWO2_01_FULL_43_83]OHA38972.1 MAG: hypothetical protein A3H58_00795 [Candi
MVSIFLNFYQEDFLTPGIIPSLANSLKQILHKSKSLIKPLFLPHLKHLLTTLEANFGGFCDLAITDFFAINNFLTPHCRCGVSIDEKQLT